MQRIVQVVTNLIRQNSACCNIVAVAESTWNAQDLKIGQPPRRLEQPVDVQPLGLATGAFMWLFYREFLMSDRFWVVVVALAIAVTAVQNGYTKTGAIVALVGIAIWLWMEYRSRDD